MGSYATDGKCHNANNGTYGHECGKPAEWIGTSKSGFRSGYCLKCRATGDEARHVVKWEPLAPALSAAGYVRTDMGGGIMGWLLRFGAGELLISNEGEIAGDDIGDSWTVGLYGSDHSEPLREVTGVLLPDAIEAGEVFRLQAAGRNA